MITQTLDLDLIPGQRMHPVINLNQYDAGKKSLIFNLFYGSVAFEIPTTAKVLILGTKPDNKGFSYVAEFEGSTVYANIEEQMTAVPGNTECELRIIDGEEFQGTLNFVLRIERAGMTDGTDVSKTEIPAIEDMARSYADNAGKSEAAAATSATSAANSATAAANSATAAATSETNAATSESNIANSEAICAQSELEAKNAAIAAKNSATLSEFYSDFVTPDLLLDGNRIYIKTESSTFEFVVQNNRLYITAPETSDEVIPPTALTEVNSRLDAVENVNTTQDSRLEAVENVNTTQDSRLEAVENVNTTQDSRLDAVEVLSALLQGGGAGLHNSVWRGKYLGSEITEAQSAAIADGSFDDLWIGDYWVMDGYTFRIMAFDYFYARTVTFHHLIAVSDYSMGLGAINSAGGATGGWYNSELYSYIQSTIGPMIEGLVGSDHLVSVSQPIHDGVDDDGFPNSASWYTTKADLLTEPMISGTTTVSAGNQYAFGLLCEQLAGFRLNHQMKINFSSDDYNAYWLRDIGYRGNGWNRVWHSGRYTQETGAQNYAIRPWFVVK